MSRQSFSRCSYDEHLLLGEKDFTMHTQNIYPHTLREQTWRSSLRFLYIFWRNGSFSPKKIYRYTYIVRHLLDGKRIYAWNCIWSQTQIFFGQFFFWLLVLPRKSSPSRNAAHTLHCSPEILASGASVPLSTSDDGFSPQGIWKQIFFLFITRSTLKNNTFTCHFKNVYLLKSTYQRSVNN